MSIKSKTVKYGDAVLVEITGFDGYFADKDGNLYSSHNKHQIKMIKKLSQYYTSCGVLAVKVKRNGKYNNHSVVRLLALAFLGAPPTPRSKAKLVMPDMPIMASNVRWA